MTLKKLRSELWKETLREVDWDIFWIMPAGYGTKMGKRLAGAVETVAQMYHSDPMSEGLFARPVDHVKVVYREATGPKYDIFKGQPVLA